MARMKRWKIHLVQAVGDGSLMCAEPVIEAESSEAARDILTAAYAAGRANLDWFYAKRPLLGPQGSRPIYMHGIESDFA